ncbi:MAG: RsmE family RNA methyltransferase [Vicinamibacterales bacterium]
MNLLLLEPHELGPDDVVVLADTRARHLQAVLAVVPNDNVRIGIVDGAVGTATVLSSDRESGHVTLRCHVDGLPPPMPRVDLLLAVPRPKVLRRLWPQLAALGVGRIVLTNAARVERNYFDTHLLAADIYRPLLIEGLQQARDTRVPEVSVHRQFRILVEDHLDQIVGRTTRLVADPGASVRVADAVRPAVEQSGRVLLAVGPEGGWNRFEIDLLSAHGFRPVTMGARTLRSDTACIALLALVHDALAGSTPSTITSS